MGSAALWRPSHNLKVIEIESVVRLDTRRAVQRGDGQQLSPTFASLQHPT